jgi:hypothetical protein
VGAAIAANNRQDAQANTRPTADEDQD